jgi:RNA polymerase sigma-70 factor, ECF subfamily
MVDDQQIIDAIRAGDASQFEHLMVRYQRRLLGLLWHACGDHQLSEDISQEAFFRAFRKLHLYSAQAQFFTWLAKIALNLLASAKRTRRLENQLTREGMQQVLETVGQEICPGDPLETNECQTWIRQAIAMLDEDRKLVLLLRDFEDMDYDTIAQVLNIPVGTVRSRLHRARTELRQIIQTRFAHRDRSEGR